MAAGQVQKPVTSASAPTILSAVFLLLAHIHACNNFDCLSHGSLECIAIKTPDRL
jgi:hypothetical protein